MLLIIERQCIPCLEDMPQSSRRYSISLLFVLNESLDISERYVHEVFKLCIGKIWLPAFEFVTLTTKPIPDRKLQDQLSARLN